ncbi:FAD-dependent oxidoreductase [Gimibacter soli]|uniref:FAD-dependent oxidoreductase n=1 Tax=Gimibacter soli TaxID=3024400 RepID=A0AAE9XNE4_9PROT|nr:FAD-dependent oxidoreductase [Gimibacter soli]WCL53719.1 FAD-dependent oxidoreductase [Gimibacter soli]
MAETGNGLSNLSVAIIGAGPAGYYTAEALTDQNDHVLVDIIDALPTPFGLIRAGVAPDHQSIKNVSRRYEATAGRDHVHFIGNMRLGRDVTLAELMQLYDAVVLATGAPKDRTLGIDGENLPGVVGSGAFVGWYNSHPDFRDLCPDLQVAAVAVIGNGNVAVDVARILAKTPHEMEATDLARHAADCIHKSPIRDIYLIGRRGPLDASFTPKELGELNALEEAVALVNPADLPDASIDATLEGTAKKNMPILRAMAANRPEDAKRVRLHLQFCWRPMAVLGDERVCGLRLERTKVVDGKAVGTGQTEVLPVGLVVPAIGYRSSPIEDVPYDEAKGRFRNDDGRISDRLYAVGWAKRGPTGTIGTNKPDGLDVAARILTEVKPGLRPGRAGLEELIRDRGLTVVTFRDWKKIEAAEVAHATGGAPREKFTDVSEMVKVAKG